MAIKMETVREFLILYIILCSDRVHDLLWDENPDDDSVGAIEYWQQEGKRVLKFLNDFEDEFFFERTRQRNNWKFDATYEFDGVLISEVSHATPQF